MLYRARTVVAEPRWVAPILLVVLLAGGVPAGCRGKAADGAHGAEAGAPAIATVDAPGVEVGGPAEPDAPGGPAVAAADAASGSADAAATDVGDAPPPDVSAPDAAAWDIGESTPCDPSVPAELVALRNAEDRELRLSHARYAEHGDGEDDFCTPGADCPRPILDLNDDGRPEYVVEVGYCDSMSWWLAASTPEGYVKVLTDGEGSTALQTPRLPDGRRVVVLVHDCCCQSHVSVSQILPSGDVADLYLWISDCNTCVEWVEAQYEAGAIGVGAGAYLALPKIVDDVLLGVREPEDCSGQRYRLVAPVSFPHLPDAGP